MGRRAWIAGAFGLAAASSAVSAPGQLDAIHVAVRPDERIVLGTHGHAGADLAGFALMRLRRNGSLDRTFGRGGIAVSDVGFGVHALDRRGRIITVGRTKSLLDFVVARFLPDGRRDRGFAATVTDFGGTDTPFSLTLQPDGKIVVAGASAAAGTGLVGDIRRGALPLVRLARAFDRRHRALRSPTPLHSRRDRTARRIG